MSAVELSRVVVQLGRVLASAMVVELRPGQEPQVAVRAVVDVAHASK
jgi:hypothetical protein